MDITIKIEGLNSLAESISFLASAIAHHNGMENTVKAIAEMNKEVSEPDEDSKEIVVEPVNEPTSVPTTVPTTEKSYTLDELSKASVSLMDQGKQSELINLLQNDFKVTALPQLDKALYGQFAIKLRELGADI
ncbi:MAG: hypothetical protein GXZ08_05425 [Tissierellia bacterium]|nr:hypothetical protein [Tissierellia bacterium]